jgi:hypothetical protein
MQLYYKPQGSSSDTNFFLFHIEIETRLSKRQFWGAPGPFNVFHENEYLALNTIQVQSYLTRANKGTLTINVTRKGLIGQYFAKAKYFHLKNIYEHSLSQN